MGGVRAQSGVQAHREACKLSSNVQAHREACELYAAQAHWEALGFLGISPTRVGSLRGNLRGCAGTGSPTIHWRHRLAKRTPPRAAQACAVSRLRQRGDKMYERRTKGHVHIRLIQKNICDLVTYYTPVLVYKYDLTNKIRMHVTKDYIVGFVFEHSWLNFVG